MSDDQEETRRAQLEQLQREVVEGKARFRKEKRRLLFLLMIPLSGLLALGYWNWRYSSLPRHCEERVATVTEVISDRHCTMGCRGYDHLIQFSGIPGVKEDYIRDSDRVWRVAGPGHRIRVRVCTVAGYESSPPEIKILGRAP